MMSDWLSWGSSDWWLPAALAVGIALVLLGRSYVRSGASPMACAGAAVLKSCGIVALALCLLEPLIHGRRARPGANLFVVLADNSPSLTLRDPGAGLRRCDRLREWLRADAPWRVRLGQDFDVRDYIFDSRLQAVDDFGELAFTGSGSALRTCLGAAARRYRDRPLAGVLLFTDGNATDTGAAPAGSSDLPPVYPVVVGGDGAVRDLAVRRVSVSQTHFESAPVTLHVEVSAQGFAGEEVVTEILDEAGTRIERVVQRAGGSGRLTARFEPRPEGPGVHFYTVRVASTRHEEEATLANNTRVIAVDRPRGPYRVLYVSGRPNWEFKFLRRALAEDEEVELVALVRIARREPKFDYRGRAGESTNPLFRGFGREADEEAERYDEPVLLRLGTLDEDELRGGFPRTARELFRYAAVILDDVEAGYFTRDRMTLLQEFVSRRGGGLLMLGGSESFGGGEYRRTPIGELLPVYLDGSTGAATPASGYRWSLTREGLLQPWVRLRRTEEEEERRLGAMPAFRTLNPAGGRKPGATVLARVSDGDGGVGTRPALAAQRFGRGRAAALLVGDLWRWGLRRRSAAKNDLAMAWRQTVRWLVADVPARVEVAVRHGTGPGSPVRLRVTVRDEKYEPLDNASVVVEVSGPGARPLELRAEPGAEDRGVYEVSYTPRRAGAYRARARVRGPDGGRIAEREVGWTAEPGAREYERLEADRAFLERLAKDSGGEIVEPERLEEFAAGLPHRRTPVTDPWTYPLWHQWSVMLFAVFCLTGEWGLRRWKGLP